MQRCRRVRGPGLKGRATVSLWPIDSGDEVEENLTRAGEATESCYSVRPASFGEVSELVEWA